MDTKHPTNTQYLCPWKQKHGNTQNAQRSHAITTRIFNHSFGKGALSMQKITIRGIRFDNVDMDGALLLAKAALENEGVTSVVTPNAEIAQMCLEDTSLSEIINAAEIILPDGAGVVMASEILGTPLRGKVAGVEFGENVLSMAADMEKSVFFLGGRPGVADTAAEKLRGKFPALQIAGTNDGYFEKSGAENDAVIDKINASDAEILFVWLGAPLQEKWLYENKTRLTHVRLAACLGGSLDIYAGTAKRAPKFFIKAHMEWFYRLIKEPKRIGRMMKLPKYIAGTYRDAHKIKKRG